MGWFWIVGAVFNRDYPLNRGWKPLPLTINFSLSHYELFGDFSTWNVEPLAQTWVMYDFH